MSLPFYRLKNHICRDPIADWFEMKDGFIRDELSDFHQELITQKTAYVSDFVDHFRYTHSTIFYSDLTHTQTIGFLKDKKDFLKF